MEVIRGQNIDLISPFPVSEIDRIYGWVRSFKNIIEFDGWLKNRQDFKEHYTENVIPRLPTYGVIDKENKAIEGIEAPLVGFISTEATLPSNAYIQMCSNAKALKADLMAEALNLVMGEIFKDEEKLRVSTWILSSNREAYKFFRDNGFKKEGTIEKFVTQRGVPKSVIHMGYLR